MNNKLSNPEVGYLTILTSVLSLKLTEDQWRKNKEIFGEEILVWDELTDQQLLFQLVGKINGNYDLMVSSFLSNGEKKILYLFPLDYYQEKGKKLPWVIIKFAKIALASIRN